MEIKKKIIFILCLFLVFALCLFFSFLIGSYLTKEKLGSSAFTPNQTVVVPPQYTNKYSYYIDDEKAFYIDDWCNSLKVDTDLVIAILMEENPEANPEAIGRKNSNNTHDLGLFQINSRYLNHFQELYWSWNDKWLKDPLEFDPLNWQHNSYLAIRLIKDLSKNFNNDIYKVACAYNCGATATFENKIPETTKKYAKSVLNRYNSFKGENYEKRNIPKND